MENESNRPPRPDSTDFDYTQIDRKSEQAEVEMQEITSKGLPLDDLATLNDIRRQITEQDSPNTQQLAEPIVDGLHRRSPHQRDMLSKPAGTVRAGRRKPRSARPRTRHKRVD